MPILIYPLALLSALITLALCTPRQWWQRPTALIAALLIASTCAYAQAWQAILPENHPTPPQPSSQPTPNTQPNIYRAKHALNLRAAPGTSAKKQGQIAAQQLLISTGKQEGDWWQVASCTEEKQTGWVNSLWLRRLDESPPSSAQTAQLAKCEIRKR